jgi:hypothetical protein
MRSKKGVRILGIHFGIETQWGGFYIHCSKVSFRICLGFIAITILPIYFDDMLEGYIENEKRKIS